jgi:hypothetical protein
MLLGVYWCFILLRLLYFKKYIDIETSLLIVYMKQFACILYY